MKTNSDIDAPGSRNRRVIINVAKEKKSSRDGVPIEIDPVVEAVKEYGRKTHSLGAAQGAAAIRDLIGRIKGLGSLPAELESIVKAGEVAADELSSYFKKAYERL